MDNLLPLLGAFVIYLLLIKVVLPKLGIHG